MKKVQENAITLIALVVTIVVLLILAGVTINLLFSNDGIFNIANQSKIEYEIGALKDRINNVIADWSIERAVDSSITVDILWDKMVEADIIDNPEEDVAGPEKEEENDIYQVTTNEGYIVEVIISPDGSVVIGDEVKGDSLPPKIVNVETSSGTNNIQVTVTMSRWENGTISYYYKKDGEEDTSYKLFKENTTELTANIEGLEQNVIYNIKIIAENENGSTEKVVKETTGRLKEGTISQKGETVWSNGTASIELETSETGVTIQYQIDGIEGEWQDYKGAITGLNHGQTVFAVISDGSNISGHTAINILDEKEPTVTVTKGAVTTNRIQVQVKASDAEWGMPETVTYNYYIKQTGGSYKAAPDHTGPETNYTFTGLTQNTSYDVKVTTRDKAGNLGEGQVTNITTDTVGGAGEDLKEGNIVASDQTWKDGTASITLSKGTGVASTLTIQYQVGGIEGNWTTAQEGANSVTVAGLKHNSIVYARLTDGVNTGSYASATILDKIAPQSANMQLSGQSITTIGSITATVTHTDKESGVDIGNCKWVYNTNQNKIGTETSSYPNTFSSNGQTITLSASNPGIYYLHVLTQDVAGNKTETISQGITVTQLVTNLTVSPTSVTLEEGKTQQLTASIAPDNASNKTVSWSSNNTNIATVSSTGLVTAKTAGTVTITVKTNDGSGVSGTCNVTVNPTLPTIEEVLKKGKYVTYVDGKGTTRNCVVLYDNSSSCGIEIITMESIEDVELGNGTGRRQDNNDTYFNTALNSYNNMINILNDATSDYLNTTYADKVRCVGSNPNNPSYDTAEMLITDYNYMSRYDGKFKNEDENYSADWLQMNALDIHDIDYDYWLASRTLYSDSEDSSFGGRFVYADGSRSNENICYINSFGDEYSFGPTFGLRPVFHLKSGLKVTGGNGSSNNPYTLGI